ncbi:hypothetical protein BD779DRAFT_1474622 [Infundibulicybe gibba]|nr:hypothetical protein BD779DRAFT_1474622 [Infundibulicybe gibba]
MSVLPPVPANVALLAGPPPGFVGQYSFGSLDIYRLNFPNDKKYLKTLARVLRPYLGPEPVEDTVRRDRSVFGGQIVGGIGIGIVLWLGGSAITDTLIAVSLTSLLLKSKSKSKQANDIVLGVVRLTVETNALTDPLLVMTKKRQKTTIFMCPCYVLGKLYSNTLMTMLNNRAYVQGKFNPVAEEAPVTNHGATLQIATLGNKSEVLTSSGSFSEL